MALFTADAHFVVYMDAKDPTPTQELRSREGLAPGGRWLGQTVRRVRGLPDRPSFAATAYVIYSE
jgi:hypothetical protein